MSGKAVRRHRRTGSSSLVADEDVAPGSGKSYGELYVEYAPAARRFALSMVPPDAADDIVAEAFARVLAAIRRAGDRITRSADTCWPPCATAPTTGSPPGAG